MWKDDGTVNWHEVIERLTQRVHQRISDPPEADDLAQDILERLVLHGDQLTTVENPLGWMRRIAINAIIDHYRRQKPHVALSETLTAKTEETTAISRQELAACLAPLILRLDRLSRQALLAADLGGKSQVEAAQEAGIAVSTMKSRVQRGRAKLRDAVLRCCHVELDRRNGIADFSRRRTCGSNRGSCCVS